MKWIEIDGEQSIRSQKNSNLQSNHAVDIDYKYWDKEVWDEINIKGIE